MSKARHTRGPWIAGRNLCGELAIFTAKGNHTLSGEGEKPLPPKQREANAQLQAAAPAMYLELQTVCEYLLKLYDQGNSQAGQYAASIDTTLAQAEGK